MDPLLKEIRHVFAISNRRSHAVITGVTGDERLTPSELCDLVVRARQGKGWKGTVLISDYQASWLDDHFRVRVSVDGGETFGWHRISKTDLYEIPT